MTDNKIIEKYFDQNDISPKLQEITTQICRDTGFELAEELHRRFIYEKEKTWRVKYLGSFEGRPAVLLVVGMKLEEDEESIREAFREQAVHSRVRPPHTYVHVPFREKHGFGFTIEEHVDAPPLFENTSDPEKAVQAFIPFYRDLRLAVAKPFWPNEKGTNREYTLGQADAWLDLARKKHPERLAKTELTALRFRDAMLACLRDEAPLQFVHAHLAPGDVRRLSTGDYVVYANHFWSWRQPAYDIAFVIWQQWMALPPKRRSADEVRKITETWRENMRTAFPEFVRDEDLKAMLLNRIFGTLILDLPAKRMLEGETGASIKNLEEALIKEGERLVK